MRRLTTVAGLAAALLVGAAVPALAAPPSGLTDQVTDRADVMDDAEEAEARDALEELDAETGTEAYVVFVDSFDGLEEPAWAESTFEQSGLGADDVVVAVAVEDREYQVGRGTDVDPSELQDVLAGDFESLLSQSDWSGASVALAEGLAADGGGGSAAAESSSGGGGGAALVVVLLLFALAAGGYWFVRSRRRKQVEAGRARQLAQADPHASTPTEELNFRASTELLELDERVRGAQLDLDYARTHFGEQAVPGLPEALAESRGELTRAFTIRQELDDEIPEDEPTQRRMLTELLALTDAAGQRLRAQGEAIEALREQERAAPETVSELERRIDALRGRLPGEESRLEELQRRYAAAAVAPVVENVAEADVRLDAAAQELDLARSELGQGLTGRSVGRLRGVENAVGQSATLLDAIGRLAGDLAAAEQRIPAARADIEEDLAEARTLDPATPRTDLQPLIARAEAALAGAEQALHPRDGGLPDPLGALRRLEEAGAALEEALGEARDEHTRIRRAQEALGQAMLTARSAVAAADDFIGTRRGAVGPTARTRLAEAQRHLSAAAEQADRDPSAALQEAHAADRLAQYAMQAAENDVRHWSQRNQYGGYGGWGSGGYGGGYGGRRGGIGPVGAGLGGLLLGGLIFGGGDSDWGGGDWNAGDFGGGDWGGGFGGDFGGGDF